MKSYKELAGKYLKNQKKRSILTIVGIILSVSLLCAAGIMGESFRNMLFDDLKQQYGNYHVAYGGINEAQLKKLQSNIKVDRVGYRMIAGLDMITPAQNLMIAACDTNCLEMLYLKLSSGRLPAKENEIVLEQWIIDNMKSQPAIGGMITLDFTIQGLKDGKSEASRDFKLVGILKNNALTQRMGMSFGVVSFQTAKSILKDNDAKIDAVVLIKKKLPLQQSISEITNSIGAKGQAQQNTAILSLEGQGNRNDINKYVYIVQAIMMLVIIISTIAVIYNAFHISVLERIHQFGVLRSVGTTPRQIRTIILREAGVLGIIGIPLGLLFGILAMKVVIGLFSFQSSAFFGSMQVVVPAQTVIMTAVLGFATLLVSAFGPAASAGRVSPMEAVLNSSRSKKLNIRRKKHPILSKILHIEGVMAYENLRRNRKRFFVTVFSMCIGIVLFIFFSFFMSMMYVQTNTGFEKAYAVDKPFSSDKPGFTQKDYDEISGISGINTVYRVMQKNERTLISEEQASDTYKKAVKEGKSDGLFESGGITNYSLISNFYGYRDLELGLCESNVIQGKIDIDKMNAENGVLVSQSVQLRNGQAMNASQLKAGNVILITDTKDTGSNKPVKLKVVGILDRMPLVYTGGADKFGIITTEEVFKKITGINTYSRFDVVISRSADLASIEKKLKDIAARVEQGRMLSFIDTSYGTLQTEMGVILYGLVAVISIIGALNIINTISTNLILRISEFGTLRAIGMTPDQIKGMIRLEGIFYGLISSFYGSIAGCALAWILYSNVNKIRGLTWHLPWKAAVEACLVAIVIGVTASLVPLKKISKMNVVESIRAEE